MKTENKKLNKIHNIEKFFIMAGLIEIFAFVFISQNLYLMIIGVITVTPAYLALKEGKIKANYFTGGWALLKYNPICLALFSFVMGDLTENNFNHNILIPIIHLGLFIIGLLSFIFGIILITKTSKYLKNNIQ